MTKRGMAMQQIREILRLHYESGLNSLNTLTTHRVVCPAGFTALAVVVPPPVRSSIARYSDQYWNASVAIEYRRMCEQPVL